MSEIPTSSPEKKDAPIDDNARKFETSEIDSDFLHKSAAKSYLLITDWLEMGEDSEVKLAYKQFENGNVQILRITKFTDKDGNRTVPPKETLSVEEYEELLKKSVCRVEKKRYEFAYAQGDKRLSMKYDVFTDSELRVLEVDAEDDATRESFEPDEFPYPLAEVTGQIQYYGYRVAQSVKLKQEH